MLHEHPATLAIYGGRDPRHVPIYAYAEAARLARVPQATLRSWVIGRRYTTSAGERFSEPIIRRPDPQLPLVSFTNVIEAHVLSCIRTIHNVALDKVRLAVEYTELKLGLAHPLASGRFETDGIDLFVDQLGLLVNVSKSGQIAMRALIGRLLKRVEIDEDQFARRFYPIVVERTADDGPTSIMVDPMVAFGRPVLTGTGVPVDVLWQRFEGGDSFLELANDYGVEVSQIEDAIRFGRRAA